MGNIRHSGHLNMPMETNLQDLRNIGSILIESESFPVPVAMMSAIVITISSDTRTKFVR